MDQDKKLHLSRRTFVAGAAAAAFTVAGAAALQGCGGTGSTGGGTDTGGDSSKPTADNTLSYYLSEPACIDPFDLKESEGTVVGSHLFDSLVDYDFVKGELIPAAAKSWEVSDDATVFTFTLREGATFHNGDPVTAASFKYGWERMCNPKTDPTATSEITYHLAMVEGYQALVDGEATQLTGVKAIDDLTLEVTLTQAYADFIFVVMHPGLAPIPEVAGDDFTAFQKAPIGNGPFKIDGEWVHDQYIRVLRFDDYYGNVPLVDGIDFKIFQSPDTAFTEFQAGNLDFTQIGEGQVLTTAAQYGESSDGWTVNPGQQTLMGPESSTYYIFMNNKDAALSDVKVRTAISYAINRQAICDVIFEGTRAPADGIVPPGIDGYKEGAWPTAQYDVEKAKAALADAGFPGGEGFPTLKLSFNTGGGHENLMQMIQADLKAIGINADLDSMEWANYLDAIVAGQIQIGRLGWIADYPIMDNFLFSLFQSESGDNHSHLANPAVDAALLEARAIVDDDARAKKYQEIDALIAAEVPVAPIMFYRHHHVGSDRVNDLFYGPNYIPHLNEAWLTK